MVMVKILKALRRAFPDVAVDFNIGCSRKELYETFKELYGLFGKEAGAEGWQEAVWKGTGDFLSCC
ncbi:MAG: hypothetical protein HY717_03745 [Planctomycetes bacterium]|nr:hypothetical protein [Planctomycetota bacterium]